MTRKIRRILTAKPTSEGAGVRLHRAFGPAEVPELDPFLLLDDFRSDDPSAYRSGFPWHPHRGIETITYMLEGEVEHGDSLGNRGVIRPGDVQWMTAGSGIVHQEMPAGDPEGCMGGFQLWANLPAADKMADPLYRGIADGDIPEVGFGDATVRVICGEIGGTVGPVRDVVVEPRYLDVSLPAGSAFAIDTEPGHTVFAYVVEGEAAFGPEVHQDEPARAVERDLVIFGDGEDARCRTAESDARFLLVSGKPIGEPVAWGGPIVMNTDDELRTAFREYREGTFVKTHEPVMDW